MEGVEHLGQYVFEMTNTRIQQLQVENGPSEEVSAALPLSGTEVLEAIPEDAAGDDEEEVEAAHVAGFEAEEN